LIDTLPQTFRREIILPKVTGSAPILEQQRLLVLVDWDETGLGKLGTEENRKVDCRVKK
jgi:hypothetical protein